MKKVNNFTKYYSSLGGHYKICVYSNDSDFYTGRDKIKFSLTIDTRDNKVLPATGINWISTIKRLSGIGDKSYNKVTQVNSDFSFYFNLIPDRLVFADRVGGGINYGNGFEFYQAQYLGSNDNLRGYRKDRFAGKSKFYNQAELRLRLANFRTYLFPAAFGVMAFFDAGRVWKINDTDKKTLSGYGGGICSHRCVVCS